MKGIILASHGRLAEGLLDTLEMFSGKIPQLETLCLLPGEEVSEFLNRIKTAIDTVETGDGVLIFCDLLFGTPCNCSGKLCGDITYIDKIQIITGMNLPMVLEYVGSRNIEIENETIIQIGQQGIKDLKIMMEEQKR